jgi:hypothetical protein
MVAPVISLSLNLTLTDVSVQSDPKNILSSNPQKYFLALGNDVNNNVPGVKTLFVLAS